MREKEQPLSRTTEIIGSYNLIICASSRDIVISDWRNGKERRRFPLATIGNPVIMLDNDKGFITIDRDHKMVLFSNLGGTALE